MSRENMHGQVEWMVAADESILRLLVGPPRLELRPSNIARNVGYKPNHVGNRCRFMKDRIGALESDDAGYYWATETGVDVWEMNMTIEEINRLDPEYSPDES